MTLWQIKPVDVPRAPINALASASLHAKKAAKIPIPLKTEENGEMYQFDIILICMKSKAFSVRMQWWHTVCSLNMYY